MRSPTDAVYPSIAASAPLDPAVRVAPTPELPLEYVGVLGSTAVVADCTLTDGTRDAV